MSRFQPLDKSHTSMSVQELKKRNPSLFQEVYNRGIKAEKRRMANERFKAEIRAAVRTLPGRCVADLF